MVKNPPVNAGDMGLISDPGRSHMPQGNEACAPQVLSLRAIPTEAQETQTCALQQEATAMKSPCPPLKSSPCPHPGFTFGGKKRIIYFCILFILHVCIYLTYI